MATPAETLRKRVREARERYLAAAVPSLAVPREEQSRLWWSYRALEDQLNARLRDLPKLDDQYLSRSGCAALDAAWNGGGGNDEKILYPSATLSSESLWVPVQHIAFRAIRRLTPGRDGWAELELSECRVEQLADGGSSNPLDSTVVDGKYAPIEASLLHAMYRYLADHAIHYRDGLPEWL